METQHRPGKECLAIPNSSLLVKQNAHGSPHDGVPSRRVF